MTPREDSPERSTHSELIAKLTAGLLGITAVIGNISEHTAERAKAASTTTNPNDQANMSLVPGTMSIDGGKEYPKRDKRKLEKEKKGPCVDYPSGLRLEITTDQEALQEWKDPTDLPFEVLRRTFGGSKTQKDIDTSTLNYVKTECSNRVPVVRISPEDLEQKISKYFTVRELVKIDARKKDLMEKEGTWQKHEQFMIRDSKGNYCWAFARIDPNLCKRLDEVREEADCPMVIDEGVRPYGYNVDMYRANGGHIVYGSPHVPGRAVDICRVGDSEQDARLKGAIQKVLDGKGGGIGYGNSVYHFDVKIAYSKKGGNWIVDPKTGRVTLRTREWNY